MTVRCIAFDLDDTLWECEPVITRAEQACYAWLTTHYPCLKDHYSYSEFIAYRVHYAQAHPELRHDLSQLRKAWLADLAQQHQLNTDLVEPAFEAFYQARQSVTLFPEVETALYQLKTRYQLGTITNGNADMRRLSIGTLFDFHLSSAQAGVAKPHPDIFHQAAALVGVRADEMVYIGDDLEKDILGPQMVGMKTIWFNPKQQPLPSAIKPDAIMINFAELHKLIPLL